MTRALNTRLASICSDDYGVGIVAAPPETILWAADQVAEERGEGFAKRELKTVNRCRERHGVIPAYVPYGHRLF